MWKRKLAYLDEQVEVPKVVVAARRSVATHDVLAIDLSRNGDVLTNRETEDILRVGKRETVAGSIWCQCSVVENTSR